ncbi:MAG: TIGR02221 family CRISPR-associated protein [Desulfobulbus sp.]|nr:TIGR02221 family CRISPR-associated protein [Desulfobulbus sp.]
MAKIFVSFLGIGNHSKKPGYETATYFWPEKGNTEITVRFVQTAILTVLEQESPVDTFLLLCTEDSKEKHLHLLQKELQEHLPTGPMPTVPQQLVPTDMQPANQWKWFEQLLERIQPGDRLTIDFTHGMRAIPIVFSSAIGFLQRAKGVQLEHALYGWYDPAKKDEPHPIVDMRDFYIINDWTEAVARLADDADARKLGELAKTTRVDTLQPLADPSLISSFTEMTDCIRNVDVNNISNKVGGALNKVEQARKGATGSAQVMLDLVRDKFTGLASNHPASGRYDLPYFQTQLEIISLLLEHRLFMQAFTAMREFVGSIGMAGLTGKYANKKMSSSDGRRYRRRFAEVFVNMMQVPQEEWKFFNKNETDKETLMPWYEKLQNTGVEQQLRSFVKDLVDTRNGFDHAWTSKAEAYGTVEQDGRRYFEKLKNILEQLKEKGWI